MFLIAAQWGDKIQEVKRERTVGKNKEYECMPINILLRQCQSGSRNCSDYTICRYAVINLIQ